MASQQAEAAPERVLKKAPAGPVRRCEHCGQDFQQFRRTGTQRFCYRTECRKAAKAEQQTAWLARVKGQAEAVRARREQDDSLGQEQPDGSRPFERHAAGRTGSRGGRRSC